MTGVFLIASLYLGVAALEAPDQETDTLRDDYTLGRIPSAPLIDNLLAWGYLAETDVTVNLFAVQTGSEEGNLSFGTVPAIVAFGVSEGAFIYQIAPSLSLTWKAGNANRLSTSIGFANFWREIDNGDSFGGIEYPWLSLHRYAWELLTRGGRIAISPGERGLAFVLGPLLDKKQVRNDFALEHTLVEDERLGKRILVHNTLSVGLAPSVNVGIGLKVHRLDSATFRIWVSEYSVLLQPRFDVRGEHLFGRVEGRFEWDRLASRLGGTDVTTESEPVGIHGMAGYYHYRGCRKFSAIEGNFDGFNSYVLLKNEMFHSLAFALTPSYEIEHTDTHRSSDTEGAPPNEDSLDMRDNTSYTYPVPRVMSIRQRSRFGLTDHVELSDELGVELTENQRADCELSVSVRFSNASPRDYGPSEASNQEYFHGRDLRPGEVRGYVTCAGSLPRDRSRYYGHVPIRSRLKTSVSPYDRGFGGTFVDGFSIDRYVRPATLLEDTPDFAANLSWRVSRRIQVTNLLELDVIGYDNDSLWIYENQAREQRVAERTTVFSNLIGLAYHTTKGNRLLLFMHAAHQSEREERQLYEPSGEDHTSSYPYSYYNPLYDGDTYDEDTWFSIGLTYQGAFPR